jgi:hypothetical protein
MDGGPPPAGRARSMRLERAHDTFAPSGTAKSRLPSRRRRPGSPHTRKKGEPSRPGRPVPRETRHEGCASPPRWRSPSARPNSQRSRGRAPRQAPPLLLRFGAARPPFRSTCATATSGSRSTRTVAWATTSSSSAARSIASALVRHHRYCHPGARRTDPRPQLRRRCSPLQRSRGPRRCFDFEPFLLSWCFRRRRKGGAPGSGR